MAVSLSQMARPRKVVSVWFLGFHHHLVRVLSRVLVLVKYNLYPMPPQSSPDAINKKNRQPANTQPVQPACPSVRQALMIVLFSFALVV